MGIQDAFKEKNAWNEGTESKTDNNNHDGNGFLYTILEVISSLTPDKDYVNLGFEY